jgi:hypothetical protein
MLKMIKRYTCVNNVLCETDLNIQELAENSPFILEYFKIFGILRCQRGAECAFKEGSGGRK